jgi:predicted ATPase
VLYPDVEYALKHRLTQEVAYASQLSERRARTHAAVARALSKLAGGEDGGRAEPGWV